MKSGAGAPSSKKKLKKLWKNVKPQEFTDLWRKFPHTSSWPHYWMDFLIRYTKKAKAVFASSIMANDSLSTLLRRQAPNCLFTLINLSSRMPTNTFTDRILFLLFKILLLLSAALVLNKWRHKRAIKKTCWYIICIVLPLWLINGMLIYCLLLKPEIDISLYCYSVLPSWLINDVTRGLSKIRQVTIPWA